MKTLFAALPSKLSLKLLPVIFSIDISSSNPEPPVFWVPTMDKETFTEEVAELYTTVSFTEVPVIRSKMSLVLDSRPDEVINAI